jgi:hypothetical protein
VKIISGFAGLGDYYVLKSKDGEIWSSAGYNNGGIYNNTVAFGNGVFVRVSYEYTYPFADWGIFSSTDGTTWTDRTHSLPSTIDDLNLTYIDYCGGLFVAVGKSVFIFQFAICRKHLTPPEPINHIVVRPVQQWG